MSECWVCPELPATPKHTRRTSQAWAWPVDPVIIAENEKNNERTKRRWTMYMWTQSAMNEGHGTPFWSWFDHHRQRHLGRMLLPPLFSLQSGSTWLGVDDAPLFFFLPLLSSDLDTDQRRSIGINGSSVSRPQNFVNTSPQGCHILTGKKVRSSDFHTEESHARPCKPCVSLHFAIRSKWKRPFKKKGTTGRKSNETHHPHTVYVSEVVWATIHVLSNSDDFLTFFVVIKASFFFATTTQLDVMNLVVLYHLNKWHKEIHICERSMTCCVLIL